MKVYVTKHAEKRLKERSGLGKKASRRLAEKVYFEGTHISDTKGKIRRRLNDTYAQTDNKDMTPRIHGDKIFIYGRQRDEDNKVIAVHLITVLQLKSWLTKDLSEFIQED
jgi:hypothetical protein